MKTSAVLAVLFAALAAAHPARDASPEVNVNQQADALPAADVPAADLDAADAGAKLDNEPQELAYNSALHDDDDADNGYIDLVLKTGTQTQALSVPVPGEVEIPSELVPDVESIEIAHGDRGRRRYRKVYRSRSRRYRKRCYAVEKRGRSRSIEYNGHYYRKSSSSSQVSKVRCVREYY